MAALAICVVALIAGGVGSLLGISSGVLLVPLLTGVFGIPMKTAIGTSIVSIIAASSAAGAVSGGPDFSHMRLAIVLQVAMTAGAVIGGMTAALVHPRILESFFALVLVSLVYRLHWLPRQEPASALTGVLDTRYTDPATGATVAYGVRNLPAGIGASFLAGNISGLLGIGGGMIKVPILSRVMGMPLRAAIATSNTMIGVTAAVSALIYYQHGFLDPNVTIPTLLGVLLGARIGTFRAATRCASSLKLIVQGLLVIFAVQMVYQAVMG